MNHPLSLSLPSLALALTIPAAFAETTRTLNNGNLVLSEIPEIPAELAAQLTPYENVRSAGALTWTADGQSLLISTRFGQVSQIHRVDQPGGARHQLTFFKEPVGSVSRRPDSDTLLFSMDEGGSEFAQLYLFDPKRAERTLITDGKSKNGSTEWSRDGKLLAYQSTRRNGASNDIWLMAPEKPEEARVILESPDGTYWLPSDFSAKGDQLLVGQYISSLASRIHLLDLSSGKRSLLSGEGEQPGRHLSPIFDHSGKGFFYMTDEGGEFSQLAHRAIANGSKPTILTKDIAWDVSSYSLNEDRTRGAFVTNEDGLSRLYLFDPASFAYQTVEGLPVGILGGLRFSPDSSRLALTMNTPRTPSDSFVLELGETPLAAGKLTRWTFSEVGGLDTSTFSEPQLIHYPTFDQVEGQPRTIPAFVYQPKGDGPHPVIISIHGGPESQSRPSFSSRTQLWIDQLGAAVILPNVRGSAGYGKTYLGLDNGFQRENAVKDIGALLEWITTQPDLDENRVVVFGGSYGGYMVLSSAVHYSDRLKAAVDIVGISNFVTFLENTQDYRRDLRRVEYGDERDPAMRKHLQAISPLTHVDKIKVPLFVIQGQNDPRVPVTEAEQIVAAVREQGNTVWYMNALNEGHGYRKKENRDIYSQTVLMFLKEYLK